MKQLLQNWRPRASEIYNLIQGSGKNQLTAKQREELQLLREKAVSDKGLTARQEVRLKELAAREKAEPELSAGAKSWLDLKLKEIIYDRSREVYTKYYDKGNEVEADGIELIKEATEIFPELSFLKDVPLKKNEKFFENEYVTGTPDVFFEEWGQFGTIDHKAAWDFQTFPLLDEKVLPKYEWQVRAYDWLVWGETNVKYEADGLKSFVIYTLVNTPELLVLDELRRWGWRNNVIDIPKEVEAEIRRLHTYDDIPLELRVKVFKVETKPADIALMKSLIRQAREYLLDKYEMLKMEGKL